MSNAGGIRMKKDLELDLLDSKVIRGLVKNDTFAQNLYAALCNTVWFHKNQRSNTEGFSVSWRTAGGIVAELRALNESYMDFYCSGIGIYTEDKQYVPEGHVTKEVETILASLGWTKHKPK